MNYLACNCGKITDLFKQIDAISKKSKKLHRETIKSTVLTPSQFSIMSLLWGKDECSFKELANIYGSSRAAMTGLIDGLERKGMITRQKHPSDRRSLLVKLTDEGKNLQEKTPSLEASLVHCCSSLKPEELGHLGRLLNKLEQALQQSLCELNE